MKIQSVVKKKKQYLGTTFEANSQIPAILIGQIGKNFYNDYNLLITGEDIFDLALHQVIEVNRVIGGRIVYLECENNDKLKSFYTERGFDLYTDDDNNPIFTNTGLIIFMKAMKNLKIDNSINRNENMQSKQKNKASAYIPSTCFFF